MERQSATQLRSVVVGLFVFGCMLAVFPTSVFSQESSTSTQSVNEAEMSYTIEQLDGDVVVGDFVVGPGKVALSLKPGESKTVEMLVTNRMGEPKTFAFEVEDVEGTKSDEQVVLLLGNDRGAYTLKDYVHIPQTEFELEHMQRARIPVTITLPADAEPGGRYGSVLVSTVSRDAEESDDGTTAPSTAIVSRIGTLFFVTTPGSTDISGEMTAFETIPKRTFFTEGPINFGITFENTGSVHLNPSGEMSITNMFGEEVGYMELDPWFSLPQSLRTREISWNRELLIGKYTASVSVNRGYDGLVDMGSVTFWVIPWKLIAITFVALFILFLLVRHFATKFEVRRK